MMITLTAQLLLKSPNTKFVLQVGL